MPSHNLAGLRFELHNARHIASYETWYQVFNMERRAYGAKYKREPEEVDTFLGAPGERLQLYRDLRRYPNAYNRILGNMYLRPRIAMAYQTNPNHPDQLVGSIWSAQTVRGSSPVARTTAAVLSRLGIRPGELNLRNVAVEPVAQARGIASALALVSIEGARATQGVTIDVHAEVPSSIDILANHGFERPYYDPDNPELEWQIDHCFGPDQEPGQLIRMTSTVGDLRDALMSRPGADEALAYIRENTTS